MNANETFMRKILGKSEQDWDRTWRITRLATYNSEVARGIVHTNEWHELMEDEQEWFNAEQSP